jgi:phosphoenolpyruvate carboxylase
MRLNRNGSSRKSEREKKGDKFHLLSRAISGWIFSRHSSRVMIPATL